MKSRLIIGAVFSGEDRPNHGRAVGKDKNKQPRPIWGEKALLWKQKPKCLFLGKKMQIKAGHLQATSHLSNPDLIKMPNRL
jgi:hypothetical protein